MMFTVALVGPDGAGKTTISRRMARMLPLPIKYIYMGRGRGSSNHLLPTTRFIEMLKGRRKGDVGAGSKRGLTDEPVPRAQSKLKRFAVNFKMTLGTINQICEECFRQGLTWYYQRRGNIVMFDRHFSFDFQVNSLVTNNAENSPGRRLHGFFLNRVYPRPDMVIYLDAPSEVLFNRKFEGTPARLEQQRQCFSQLGKQIKNFFVLDASQPEDEVAQSAANLIWAFHQAKLKPGTRARAKAVKADL